MTNVPSPGYHAVLEVDTPEGYRQALWQALEELASDRCLHCMTELLSVLHRTEAGESRGDAIDTLDVFTM